jgi:DNA-directed RNA polymerase alpha subunit
MAHFLKCNSINPLIATLSENMTVIVEELPILSLQHIPKFEVGDKIFCMHNGSPFLYTVCAHAPSHSEVLKQSVHTLTVSTRVLTGLRKGGIRTIGDLVRKTRKNLLAIPYFGKTCLRQVSEALARYDLHLAG